MTMTKKDYELIAKALNDARNTITVLGVSQQSRTHEQLKGVGFCVFTMAHRLANTNPKFDRVRFMQACGFVEHEEGGLRPIADEPEVTAAEEKLALAMNVARSSGKKRK